MSEQDKTDITFSIDETAIADLARASLAAQTLLDIPEAPDLSLMLTVLFGLGQFLVRKAGEGYDKVTLSGKPEVPDQEFSISEYLNDSFNRILTADLEGLNK